MRTSTPTSISRITPPPPWTKRSTRSSRRRFAEKSPRSPNWSEKWACAVPSKLVPAGATARRRLDAEGRFTRGRGLVKPPIQEVFRRGDEVLVQVIKESIGTKGPTLSTYISIPGRYLVLMPGLNRVGVSRKIADEGQRAASSVRS